MRFQFLATLVTIFLIGCGPAPQPQPAAQPGTPSGSLVPSALPGIEATGEWNQAKVQEFLREELELTTIALQPTGKHGYQGTGKNADGLTYTVVVKQAPGGIKVEWTSASGKGDITFGSPVP